MTLTEITDRVQTNLDDLGANFFDPNADVQPSIQDGYNLITALTESIEGHADVNFQDGLVFYDLTTTGIPDFLRIFGVYNNNTLRWMYPTSMLELYRIRDNWEMATGDPYWFLPIDYKTIALFPAMPVGTGSMTLLYKKKADVLTSNSQPQLPQEHQTVLEYYATDDLLDQAQEWTKALEYAGMMDVTIEQIRKVLRERSQPNQLYYKQATY